MTTDADRREPIFAEPFTVELYRGPVAAPDGRRVQGWVLSVYKAGAIAITVPDEAVGLALYEHIYDLNITALRQVFLDGFTQAVRLGLTGRMEP